MTWLQSEPVSEDSGDLGTWGTVITWKKTSNHDPYVYTPSWTNPMGKTSPQSLFWKQWKNHKKYIGSGSL